MHEPRARACTATRGDISDESVEMLDLADVVVAAASRARSRVPDIHVALDVNSVWVSGRPAALQRAVHGGRATVARSARGGALLRIDLPAAVPAVPIARPTTGEDTPVR